MTPPRFEFLDLTQAQDIASNAEQLRELMQTFEVSLSEEIAKINRALAAQDPAAMEFSLHTLKGFMGIFVVPSLALQVDRLYKNCRHQPLAHTSHEFNALVPSFQTLLSEAGTWLRL